MEQRLQALEEILLLKDQVKKMTASFKECSNTLLSEIESLRDEVDQASTDAQDAIDMVDRNLSHDIRNLGDQLDSVDSDAQDAKAYAEDAISETDTNSDRINELEQQVDSLESKIDEIDSHMSDMLALME